MINLFKNKLKNNEELDVKRLNEIIRITNTILKIGFILGIILILSVGTNVLKEWGVFRVIKELFQILIPFFLGLCFAWLLHPIVTYLQKKKINRVIGTFLVYGIFILLLYFILYAVIPNLFTEISELSKSLPSLLDNVKGWIDGIVDKLSSDSFDLTKGKLELYKSIENTVNSYAEKMPIILVNFVKKLFSVLWIIIFGLIIGLYLLFNFDRTNKRLSLMVPKKIKPTVDELTKKIDFTLKSFVQGTIITGAIIFLTSSLGFYLIGLKSPLFFGFFIAITNVIPYIGPYVGGAPSVIVGFAMSQVTGILTLVINILVQFIEGNFIQPLVMSKTMKLHPVTIIVGLLVFGYFFGIVGMIISTPLISIMKIIFKYFNEKYDIIDLEEDQNDGSI